jgi:hypothetical protein
MNITLTAIIPGNKLDLDKLHMRRAMTIKERKVKIGRGIIDSPTSALTKPLLKIAAIGVTASNLVFAVVVSTTQIKGSR